jgi:iron complex outermembrane recepter protein
MKKFVSCRRFSAHLLSAVSLIAFGFPALAQSTKATDAGTQTGDLQDIVVTATKRATSIQDVPFSINAQSQEAIQKSGSATLEDLSRNVAGLAIQNLGPGQSQVSIRGVSAGQIVRDQPGVKEQVGVYLDESVVSLSLFTPDFELFDLSRVETLRGPQGTLFGSGSVGGTVRYITNQPNPKSVEGTVEGNLNLVGGDDIGGSIKGAVNLPLGDTTSALRAVGYYTHIGGFIDARREGGGLSKDVNSGERYGGRLSALLNFGGPVSVTPRIVWQKTIANGFNREEVFNLYANPNTTTRPAVTFKPREQFLLGDEKFVDTTFLADLVISGELDFATITSVSTYINRDILVSRDASALTGSVSADLGFPSAGVLLFSNLRDTTRLKTFTQELRIASDGNGPLQWLLGGFYSSVKRDYAQRLPTPGYDAFTDATLGAGTSAATANGFPANSPYNSDLPYDIKQKAVFGEVSYTVAEKLTATVGGRYYDFDEARSFTTGGLFSNGDKQTDKGGSSGFSPRVLLSYKATDDIRISAQASKGFRLGGVNDPLNVPLCSVQDRAIFGGFQTYKDETVWNYEAGVKYNSSSVSFNAAFFYTDLKNLQVTLDAGSCSSRISFNVPKAHSLGGEAELLFRPVDGLDLSMTASLLESKFDSTVADGSGAVIGGLAKGNRLPSVPNLSLSASANYSFDIATDTEAFVGISFQHVGARFTQPSDQVNNPRSFVSGLTFGGATGTVATVLDLKLPAYQQINLSAGVTLPSQWEVSAYVNNLTDKNARLSFDRERGGRARLGFSTNTPRTFGMTVRKKF